MVSRRVNLMLDLTQDGLAMAFRDYERIMLRHLWRHETMQKPEAGSRELTDVVNSKLTPPPGRLPDRRSSIINAANRFVELEIWGYHEITGKGGYRKIYHAKMTEYTLRKMIRDLVAEKIP